MRPVVIGGFRRGRRTPTAATVPEAPIPLTSGTDGHNHLVSTAELDRVITTHDKAYRTLCGQTVLAASLAAPPGPRCRSCYATSPRRGSS